MLNRVVITGRLTKAPEMKYTQSGVAVTRFTVAVNRAFKSQDGEQQADFINCVAWRKQGENVANFLSKGSLVGVDGRIQTGSFEGQDGKRVFTVEVVAETVQFLEPRNSNTGNAPSASDNPFTFRGVTCHPTSIVSGNLHRRRDLPYIRNTFIAILLVCHVYQSFKPCTTVSVRPAVCFPHSLNSQDIPFIIIFSTTPRHNPSLSA